MAWLATKVLRLLVLSSALTLASCASAPPAGGTSAGGENGSVFFPTATQVFGESGSTTTYVSFLESLDSQKIDLDQAREFAGWADLWVYDGKVFVADGETPELTRYAVDAKGGLNAEGRLSFLNYGADSAAFWANKIVSSSKAYLFLTAAREVVVWDPSTLTITGTFALPELPDRAAQTLQGPTADRAVVVRGNRAYVPFYWGDFGDYSLSDDSVIVVIDTDSDEVLGTIPVPCPELNVASVDDDGTIYFSNWVYSVVPALLDGKASACSVRMLPGSDALDDWSLTYADITGGREAGALRCIGNGKALLSVFHDERADLDPAADRFKLTESENWRFWTVDLATRSAAPLEGIDWHAGGYYGAHVDGRFLVLVPNADYSSTRAYELLSGGRVEHRWDSVGWETRLFRLP